MKQGGSTTSIDVAGVAALAALSLGVYFAGVSPALQAVDAAEKERATLLTRQEEAYQLDRRLGEALRRLEALESGEARAARVQSSALDRISRISELAGASGVSITDLSPRAEVKGTRFNRVPVSVAGLGTPAAFQGLLHALHREFPDTQVSSLTITGSPENRLAPASFSAELVWYTLAAQAGGAGRAAGAAAPGGPTPKAP